MTTYSIAAGGGIAPVRPDHFHQQDDIEDVLLWLEHEGVSRRRRDEIAAELTRSGRHSGQAGHFSVGSAAGLPRCAWVITRNQEG